MSEDKYYRVSLTLHEQDLLARLLDCQSQIETQAFIDLPGMTTSDKSYKIYKLFFNINQIKKFFQFTAEEEKIGACIRLTPELTHDYIYGVCVAARKYFLPKSAKEKFEVFGEGLIANLQNSTCYDKNEIKVNIFWTGIES
jgi:hypothetical protein